MISLKSVESYKAKVLQIKAGLPQIQVVLGSGFGEALSSLSSESWTLLGEIPFAEIEGLVASTVPDHKGAYRFYRHTKSSKIVCFQMGRLHGYEGHSPRLVVQPIMIPRCAGVEKFILTNAAGGLDNKMRSGDVCIITDHINMTGTSPLIGHNPKNHLGQDLGPRFPDMGNCYHPEWRNELKKSFDRQKLNVFEGVYMGLMGPTFETHAEVKLYQKWGVSAVGMSTVWETIALHHSGATLACVSMIANQGAGLSPEAIEHEAIVEACRKSASTIINGVADFLQTELLK